MRKTIEEVLAEAAIRDIQLNYCRAVDRMDMELLRSCFHPDASIDCSFFQGGVDGFVELTQSGLAPYALTSHFTGNQLVEVKGDSAWAEHYATVTHRLAADTDGPERDFVTAIRYVDRLECRDGDWRIAKRILILDWSRTDPVVNMGLEPRLKTDGARGRADPSYVLR